MNTNVTIPRNVIIYGLCIPLAMLMGYLLTTPLDLVSLGGLLGVMGLLLVPIFLRWHHTFLIVAWNAALNAFFLPGQPRAWMLLAAVSAAFSILDRIMNKEKRLQQVPMLMWPLLFLAGVILVTAWARGGIGLRSVGGASYGGKKYMEPLFAIIGFFALSWKRIPLHKAALYTALFLLSGLTNALSNLAYSLQIYWLFWLFPVDLAVMQIQADYTLNDRAFFRLTGVAFACLAPFCFLLARHGVAGIFQFKDNWSLIPFRFRNGFYINQPFRLLGFLAAVGLSTVGGFRSMPILLGLLFVIQFCLERLYRTRLLYILVGAGLAAGLAILPFTNRLPSVMQRAISFLPDKVVKLSPAVRYDAWVSTDWRLRMWSVVVDEIPRYFWLGKGYSVDPTDLYLARESSRRGFITDWDAAYIAGDYHSGPLSILIPLGIFGTIGFVWLLVAGLIALARNYRYGPPELSRVNAFLLAFFIAQVIFYFGVFGAFSNALWTFTGTLGMSVSLNGGVLKSARSREEIPASEPATATAPPPPPTGGLEAAGAAGA
ncbi:MAG TPA: hypothetical protein DCM86_04545 [Verrucomicrobiales bacterium]|mgnify:CR=1 FL=1|nr:hypothetical protein [Verrucomicrobiales bacterium]